MFLLAHIPLFAESENFLDNTVEIFTAWGNFSYSRCAIQKILCSIHTENGQLELEKFASNSTFFYLQNSGKSPLSLAHSVNLLLAGGPEQSSCNHSKSHKIFRNFAINFKWHQSHLISPRRLKIFPLFWTTWQFFWYLSKSSGSVFPKKSTKAASKILDSSM